MTVNILMDFRAENHGEMFSPLHSFSFVLRAPDQRQLQHPSATLPPHSLNSASTALPSPTFTFLLAGQLAHSMHLTINMTIHVFAIFMEPALPAVVNMRWECIFMTI